MPRRGGGGQERQKWPRERRTGTEDRRRGRRWWWEEGGKQLGFIFMESGVNQRNSGSGWNEEGSAMLVSDAPGL